MTFRTKYVLCYVGTNITGAKQVYS